MKAKFLLLTTALTACSFGVNAGNLDLTLGESNNSAVETTTTKSSFADNTFYNTLVMSGFRVNQQFNFDYYGTGASFQYGKWFTPAFAMQLNTGYIFSRDINVNSLSLDFMMNLSNLIKYKEDRKFSVIPFLGLAANFYNNRGLDRYETCPGVNIGGQLQYALTPSVSLLAEGRTSVSYTWGDKYISEPWTNFSAIKLGVSYKFNTAKLNFGKLQNELSAANDEINRLRKEQAEGGKAEQARLAKQLANQKQTNSKLQSQLASQRKTEADARNAMSNVALSQVIFRIGSSQAPADAIDLLKYTAETIKANPSMKYVVEGYADSATGSAKYNQTLSEKRAQTIADALVDKYGVNRDQLQVVGKGGVKDLFSKTRLNRCVMVKTK